MATDEHPMAEVLTAIERRTGRIAQAKSFDGELARRELLHELYPLLAEVANAVLELDGRLADVEEGSGGGLTSDEADGLIEALSRGAAMAEIALRFVPAGAAERATVEESHAWFAQNGGPLVESIRASVGEEGAEEEEKSAPAPAPAPATASDTPGVEF